MGDMVLANRDRIERIWRELNVEFMGGHHVKSAAEYYARTQAFFPAGEGGVVAWQAEPGEWWLDTWNQGGGFPGIHALIAFTVCCSSIGCRVMLTYTGERPCGIYRRLGWTQIQEDVWAIRYHQEAAA